MVLSGRGLVILLAMSVLMSERMLSPNGCITLIVSPVLDGLATLALRYMLALCFGV